MHLYDHQERMIAAAREAIRNLPPVGRRIILQAPTGCGKTVAMAAMARTSIMRGNRVLFTCHRRELIFQAAKTLRKFGISHGFIASGMPTTADAMQIASIDTLVRRLDKIAEPHLVIIDEAHHSTAGQWRKVIQHWPEAVVVGLTATPQRLDGRGLGELYNDLVVGPSTAWLIDKGFLSPFRLFAPPIGIDVARVKTSLGDFNNAQLNEIVDKKSITGDAVEHYLKHAAGTRAIVFCVSIQHANHVADEFSSRGLKATAVSGADPAPSRDAIMMGFAAGALDVLCTVDLVSEGFDVPAVETAILLRPTQSLTLYLQQVGRALRFVPGKTALILDHAGNCHRHGMPDAERQWTLAGRIKKQAKNDEPDFAVRTCRKCFCVHRSAPKCPSCGFVYPAIAREINEIKGDLEEITRAREMRKKEIGRARTFAELEAVRKELGHKPGWSWHIMAARKRRKH
ncbi:MAG: DEAD/DEAH box helicase [Magnetococcales bacterium]|nr:DEAD/DEAH box helicase [Magnetococcales bacterium]